VKNADRTRGIVAASFEHPHLNAAIQYLATTDQTSAKTTEVNSKGVSFWATPRASNGWEGFFRVDWIEPNKSLDPTRTRVIVGGAYWFPHQGTVSSALCSTSKTWGTTTLRRLDPTNVGSRSTAS
jgi:hypothetical protein